MKNLKAIFAVGLLVMGLGFTACSSDDKYVQPEDPVHLPEDASPQNPIVRPDIEPMS
ncbi:hypothetical protein [Carboxylicivirga sp. M1479]|uniref:hypothetical protein n=1 Tax=Carboxylicivirga sp. M1479 TaxID=2594476 RepID=UPI00163D5355|nr:hypothetical protein [Carboxylicivirga sp. M1479]